jgi:exopolyphosphatase / guanosine-5'-triphosphate,3'-diphosphate pyrophosphatase
MDEKFAIIDLGTNTFHLLIAQKRGGKMTILHREKLGVRLGKSGINQDVIQDDAVDRALAVLQGFRTKMDSFNVSATHAFGTSAFRNAINADEVVRKINTTTGIQVNILSGPQEADMIYRGVRSALDFGNEISLVMDIGAGSVEFIFANNQCPLRSLSVEIGAQRILERLAISDPITAAEIQKINSFLDSSLHEVDQAAKAFPPKTLVGSSGSFDTLSDMYCYENRIEFHETDSETPLTTDFVYAAHQRIIRTTRAQRLKLPGMIELRADLIVVGSCMVCYILTKYKINQIRVSRYSLKEGVLAMLCE